MREQEVSYESRSWPASVRRFSGHGPAIHRRWCGVARPIGRAATRSSHGRRGPRNGSPRSPDRRRPQRRAARSSRRAFPGTRRAVADDGPVSTADRSGRPGADDVAQRGGASGSQCSPVCRTRRDAQANAALVRIPPGGDQPPADERHPRGARRCSDDAADGRNYSDIQPAGWHRRQDRHRNGSPQPENRRIYAPGPGPGVVGGVLRGTVSTVPRRRS